MIEDKIRAELAYQLGKLYPKVDISEKDIEITRPPKRELGDFSANVAFKLAPQLGKKPNEIAEEIADSMKSWDWSTDETKAVGGFVNIFLVKAPYHEIVKDILDKKSSYANLDIYKGQKIQVEFISANPTGPLTLANGRGGFGGDVLANVFVKNGATVEREYYVNDGGNQVKILGDSILASTGLIKKEDDYYKGEYIAELAEKYKDQLEKYTNDSFGLGQLAAKYLLENQIKPSVKKMGIKFDNWFSEKQMIDSGEVDEAIEKLKKYGHTKEEEGALWMKTTLAGDDKDRVLIKSDGEKTYFANDIAYHFDKFYKRDFNRVVNFWGADHHGYVGRMKAAVTLSVGSTGILDIVIFQMVNLIKDGKEYRMSKRKGTYVTMDDLLELISGDNPSTSAQDLREASDVARFFFLMRSFNTHMDFDIDLAKERSDKNPVFYVKYAYARMSNIIKKAEELKLPKADLSKLVTPEEIEFIDQLSQINDVIRSIVMFDDYPVHHLTHYAIETAKMFHSFYDKCRVIDENDLKMTAARLELIKAAQIVMGIVMKDLIGIEAPERR